jgi:phosphoglycerate-specific signal transduction histidine kinase
MNDRTGIVSADMESLLAQHRRVMEQTGERVQEVLAAPPESDQARDARLGADIKQALSQLNDAIFAAVDAGIRAEITVTMMHRFNGGFGTGVTVRAWRETRI